MIEKLLEGRFTRVHMDHVRLAFSEEMSEVGKFSFKKIGVLFSTILAIWKARSKHGSQVLYYPPSGPNLVPIIRDIILLLSVRWCFRQVVFHFHAGGLSEFAPRLPFLLRPFYWWAYRRPDLVIRTSALAPEDGDYFKAKDGTVVANGIEDLVGGVIQRDATPGRKIAILFTAVLIPSKGVEVLLQAFRLLVQRGLPVELHLMGRWGDPDLERRMLAYMQSEGISEHVRVLGVRTGEVKLNDFRNADLFCFPSHFEAESFPVVLMEAAQFSLPVVATAWRGIPVMVDDGVNGFLVPVKDPKAVADKLEMLVRDAGLRNSMGSAARRIFEERFTLEAFHRNMEEAFDRLPR